jgi:hypothetical protein
MTHFNKFNLHRLIGKLLYICYFFILFIPVKLKLILVSTTFSIKLGID